MFPVLLGLVSACVSAESTLLISQAVIRHGDKVPTALPIPSLLSATWDCTTAATEVTTTIGGIAFHTRYADGLQRHHGSCATEQLTALGISQQMANGTLFRARYIDAGNLLPPTLAEAVDTGALGVFSTDTERTRTSAQAFVAGLYPAVGGGSGVAIDVDTAESGSEGAFIGTPPYTPCPAYSKLTNQVKTSAAWTARVAAMAPHEATLRAAWNFTGAFPDWVAVWGVSHAQLAHGKGLPCGVSDEIFDAAASLAVQQELQLAGASTNLTRLRVGRLLGRLIATMQQARRSHAAGCRRDADSATKLQLYFAHDSTLWPLWAALGVLEPTWPGYASTLTFELHVSSSSPQQQVFEVQAFRDLGRPLPMRACASPCTLEAFVDAMRPFAMGSAGAAREACNATT